MKPPLTALGATEFMIGHDVSSAQEVDAVVESGRIWPARRRQAGAEDVLGWLRRTLRGARWSSVGRLQSVAASSRVSHHTSTHSQFVQDSH
jgi:hypothetical protein